MLFPGDFAGNLPAVSADPCAQRAVGAFRATDAAEYDGGRGDAGVNEVLSRQSFVVS